MAYKLPHFLGGYRLTNGNALTQLMNCIYGSALNASHTARQATSGLVALAGGGQTGATLIPSDVNVFATVATTGDSAILPVSAAGNEITVINEGANSMNVFPAIGETINALSANTALAVAAAAVTVFTCGVAGNWRSK